MLLTFMGVSVSSIGLFYKRLIRAYTANNKTLPGSLDKISIFETLGLSMLFIRRNIRQLFKVSLLFSLLNASPFFLLFLFFMANERDDTGFQSYATFAIFLSLAMIIPTMLSIKTVQAYFNGRNWGFREFMRLEGITWNNLKILAIAGLVIIIVGISTAVVLQLPGFTNEYSFGEYNSEGKSVPQIAFVPFSKGSMSYLLAIIAVALLLSLIYKVLFTTMARGGLGENNRFGISNFTKEWLILLISMASGALIPNVFIALAAAVIILLNQIIPNDFLILFFPVVFVIGVVGVFVGPSIGSILPATSTAIIAGDPRVIKEWVLGNGVNARDEEQG
jgi:hypothetical protein